MSLFGDEERPATKSKSSLFADDDDLDDGSNTAASGKQASRGSGLFADTADEQSDSPWGFVTSKRQGQGTVVKTLLPASDVPDSYIDAWDALLAAGRLSRSGASLDIVQQLLKDGVGSEQRQSRILDLVAPSGTASIGRGEFNVLLALIGLSQKDEEVSLDSVDDHRRRLPEPNLPFITKARAAANTTPQKENRTERTPAEQSEHIPAATHRSQPSQQQSYSFGESDPWGSPVNQRSVPRPQHDTHQSTASVDMFGDSTPQSQQTQPAFAETGNVFSNPETPEDSLPPAQRPAGDSNGIANAWGAYSGPGGLGNDGFGAVPPEPAVAAQPQQRAVPPRQYQGTEEVLTVVALPDKEGPFLFQHRNYELTSSRKSTKVIRRYSDFIWLLDCLQKKYPFRRLPLLPPKRVSINGTPVGADTSFVEKRRRGLSRFANALIRHPVLREEQLVTMFLTVPTELAAWRKQAAISVVEEFTGKPLPPSLEDSLPVDLNELFTTVRGGIQRSSEHYIAMCNLVERLVRRRDGISIEYSRMASLLLALTETSADTYRIDTNDVPMLNEGLTAMAKNVQRHQSLLEEESRAWDENVLEDLKSQRDTLVAMRDMFDRKDRFARDDIPKLEKRIASNENKLIAVRNKPEQSRKVGDAEKLEDAIMRDKESIVAQHARGVFIRECVRDEISYFQASQYHISRLCQDWSAERVRYVEQANENWGRWADAVESMPLGE